VRPPHLEDGKFGVYPRTDRNSLLLKGGPHAGGPLPVSDWGAEFADHMPEPILQALRKARTGEEGTITDRTWRERLIERFGSRWRMTKLRAAPRGPQLTEPLQPQGILAPKKVTRKI